MRMSQNTDQLGSVYKCRSRTFVGGGGARVRVQTQKPLAQPTIEFLKHPHFIAEKSTRRARQTAFNLTLLLLMVTSGGDLDPGAEVCGAGCWPSFFLP